VGASLYLYDLRPESGHPGPFALTVPPLPNDPAMDCRGAWEPVRDGQ
jgi:hypothetical protein